MKNACLGGAVLVLAVAGMGCGGKTKTPSMKAQAFYNPAPTTAPVVVAPVEQRLVAPEPPPLIRPQPPAALMPPPASDRARPTTLASARVIGPGATPGRG